MNLLITLLLLTLIPGLWRVWHGPTKTDRLLAMQLFATTGTAVLLMLSATGDRDSLVAVALVLAVLAAVMSAALVQLLRGGGDD